MRKIFTIAILALSINAFAQIPTSGLVAHYPFTNNLNDQSVNGYNGTNNGVTFTNDRFGNANSAISFDGASWVVLPNQVAITGSGSRSIFLWVKYSGSSIYCFINTGPYTNSNNFNLMNTYPSSPTILGFTSVNNDLFPTSGANIGDNQWHLIGATYDSIANNLSLYVDGILDNSSTSLTTLNTIASSNYLGRCSNPGTIPSQLRYTGFMDDVRIYNRVLSGTEISSIYNEGLCYQTITVTDTLIINANLTGFNPVAFENTIKIYPNPTSDHITIDFGSNYATMNGYTLKITNSLSQIVYTTPINTQQTTVDLSTWTGNGIYFVHLIDAQSNTIDIRKIVLQ